jgi:hypothetical protein
MAEAKPVVVGPTPETYEPLAIAYDFFNERLFDGRLPRCLMTLRIHGRAYGYFSYQRFGEVDGTKYHEIALNPRYTLQREPREVLSTAVHEMVHCQQFEQGKPSRNGYHNKEWARMMKVVGLHPSHDGKPGGKQTGQTCSHYITDGGPFDLACAELLATGLQLLYGDVSALPERKVCAECLRQRYPALLFDLMQTEPAIPAELAWAA